MLTSAVFAVACAADAWGYVRKKNDGGVEEYWQVSCIPLTAYLNGYTGLSRDEIAKSIGAASHTWSPAAVTCADGSHPFLEIVPAMAPNDAVPPKPAYDGRNTLLFYTPYRPYPENSGISSSVIASTSTWARADGHIVDADVRLNAVDHAFMNADIGFVPPDPTFGLPYDLQNALTHEFGHLLGLGHSCWNLFSDDEQPIDDQNVPVPLCDSAPADVQRTVMFATIPLSDMVETTKRNLSADDIRAVCEIYPDTQDPHACDYDVPDDGCGCGAAGGVAPAGVSLALLSLLGAALARRRRRVTTPRARRADRG